MHVHADTHTHIHWQIHTHIHTHTHTLIHTQLHRHIHTYTYTHTCIQNHCKWQLWTRFVDVYNVLYLFFNVSANQPPLPQWTSTRQLSASPAWLTIHCHNTYRLLSNSSNNFSNSRLDTCTAPTAPTAPTIPNASTAPITPTTFIPSNNFLYVPSI